MFEGTVETLGSVGKVLTQSEHEDVVQQLISSVRLVSTNSTLVNQRTSTGRSSSRGILMKLLYAVSPIQRGTQVSVDCTTYGPV